MKETGLSKVLTSPKEKVATAGDRRLAPGGDRGIMARTWKNGRYNGKDHISQEAVQSLDRFIGDIRRGAGAIAVVENYL
jgi:hypothetical protein